MSVAVKQLKEAKIAIFANGAYVDPAADAGGEYHTLRATLEAQGHKVKAFTDESAQGFANALKGRQVLVIPELENAGLPLDAALIHVLVDFVGKGGTLIIGGTQNGSSTNLLNGVFGFELDPPADLTTVSFSRTAAAAGTTFADDASSIFGNDGTYTLDEADLPANALNVYENGTQSAVAIVPFGAGQIIYLGWDWYDAMPVGVSDGGWLKLLKSAVSATDGKIVGTGGPDTITDTDTIPGQAFASEYPDIILGKGGDDYLYGAGGADTVKGGPGDDYVFGGPGKDFLYGNAGDDYIFDLAGGAKIWGGKGADTFAFSQPGLAGIGRIFDFKHGVDILFLDLNEFDALQDGILQASAFHKGAKAKTAEHRIIYKDNGTVLYDPDGSGAMDDVAFAKLDGHPKLTHDDVLVHVFG